MRRHNMHMGLGTLLLSIFAAGVLMLVLICCSPLLLLWWWLCLPRKIEDY